MVRVGDEVAFAPSHTASNRCTGKVFSCEMHHSKHEKPFAGDIIGVNIKGLDKAHMPRAGDVMVHLHDLAKLPLVSSFTAKVLVLNPAGALKVGYSPICFAHAGNASVCLERIMWK